MYIIMKASDGFQIQLDLEKFKRLQVILERKFDDIVNKEHVGGNLYMFKLATKPVSSCVIFDLFRTKHVIATVFQRRAMGLDTRAVQCNLQQIP